MDAYSDTETPKHKRLRKGTKNCTECRRRKVKCVFPSPTAARCIPCDRRGSSCVSQLEGVQIGTPPAPLASRADERGRRDDSSITDVATSVEGWSHGNLPQERDNILPTPASDHAGTAILTTHGMIATALLRSYPSSADIRILLRELGNISDLCFQFSYKSCSSSPHEAFKEQISLSSLSVPETHPILLARQMLLLAAVSRYLPKERISGLNKHQYAIMDEVAEAAVRLVTTNDAMLGSLDALECIILEAFFNIDSGNIRLAWSTIRRAVTVAQLLGLHRPGHYRFKPIDDRFDHDPEAMWTSVVSMERILSLLLGLPSSTSTVRLDTSCSDSTAQKNSSLQALCGDVLVRILNRNQIESPELALSVTKEIDSELMKVAACMPADLWRPISFAGIERDSWQAVIEARRAFDRMCYQILVVQLHLPHMLCPTPAAQTNYSKMACVNASREILTCAISLRTASSNAIGCFRMNDCLALLAGMTLVLAHATSHCSESMDQLLAHQRLSDRATVNQALECMATMSVLNEDVFAVKCAATLKDLLAIEQDAADEQARIANHCPTVGQGSRSMTIMRVPYLGAVQISRDGIRAVMPPASDHHSSDNEGVTIGGIGSICVSHSGNSTPHPGCPLSRASGEYAPREPFGNAMFRDDGGQARQASGSSQMQQTYDMSNTDGGIEDWAFQGLDTAFFDTLMRGAADQSFGTNAEADHLGFNTFN